ncbi:MAG: tRNA uridine-5-carboxymethylaminomethyl(34) synthesis GTPase MnmE [Clostridia bacterium]|nr:tRNA uridine-5-carboxymethylaminomethyl(34) synthesis GTPase MnmE [Clostridia bacterium]
MADTICAVATPAGNGGVAIIRISGDNALAVASSIFLPFQSKTPEPRKAIYGRLTFDGVDDDALGLYFPAPRSFTGEEVVELQIHGGYYLSQSVVSALIERGARLAERGEFSKRAVINGRIDISQAEGIIDVINANSRTSLRAGSQLMRGNLKQYVVETQDKITTMLAELNVAIDYPEHDIEYITSEKIKVLSQNLIEEIENILKTAKLGQKIKNGVRVVLVGDPNVGKSSLLNALVGYDRAIVTDIAGTTRDTLNESYEFDGMLFNVIDTAGIRDTEDKVESAGIARALGEVERADVVMIIEEPTSISAPEINHPNIIKVLNKADVQSKNLGEFDVIVSAKTGQNIEALKQLIFERTIEQDLIENEVVLTNTRHAECLKNARISLENTLDACDMGATLDCIAIPLKSAWEALGEITGTNADDTIIKEIFSRFCLGK